VNLQASDLLDSSGTFLSNLQEGVNPSELLGSVKIPDLGDYGNLLQSVLPKNLTSFDTDGILQLLSPHDFQDKIKKGIESVQGLIENEIKNTINEVTSTVDRLDSGNENVMEASFSEIGSAISDNQTAFLSDAVGSVSSISNIQEDVPVISKFTQNISAATDTIREFTPKQIRDLADPDNYNRVMQETLQKANTLLETDIVNTAKEFIQSPPGIGSVGTLFASANTLLGLSGPTSSGEPYSVEVKVSTYYAEGDGSDIDAFKKKTATGRQLQSGKSCAVDNVTILYNSKIEVPGVGTFVAVDKLRGGGATLQLFYDKKEQAMAVEGKLTGKMVVKVTPPTTLGSIINKVIPVSRGNDAKLI